MNLDYYETLGIDKSADLTTIKSAYKSLAKKYHPDISKEENSAEKFNNVQTAYNVLKDPQKRKDYDMYGHARYEQQSSSNNGYNNYYSNNFSNFQRTRWNSFKKMPLYLKILLGLFLLAIAFVIIIISIIGFLIKLIYNIISSIFR